MFEMLSREVCRREEAVDQLEHELKEYRALLKAHEAVRFKALSTSKWDGFGNSATAEMVLSEIGDTKWGGKPVVVDWIADNLMESGDIPEIIVSGELHPFDKSYRNRLSIMIAIDCLVQDCKLSLVLKPNDVLDSERPVWHVSLVEESESETESVEAAG